MNPFAALIELPVHYTTSTPDYRRMIRNEYIRRQGNKCCHCEQLLDGPPARKIEQSPIDVRLFPEGFFNNPIHLHHDHRTDLTIGAVHARCNAWLWQYKGE